MSPAGDHADGYLRFAAVHGDTVFFVAEDDVWTVPLAGGTARRLTSHLLDLTRPAVAPDGSVIAFASKTEGQSEVYVMPAAGGTPRRITWLGDDTTAVRGFLPDGRILVSSAAGSPFGTMAHLHAVPVEGGPPERLPYGPASDLAYGPGGAALLGRNTADPARWKRYRGGTAGRLWLDPDGAGSFHQFLADLDSNIASPMWVGDRVHFLSDHEGVGNLYSCRPDGGDLRRHTDHERFYARWAATDGHTVVYQHAGELWQVEPAAGDTGRPIPVTLAGPRGGTRRTYAATDQRLGDVALHPAGKAVVADVRGKLVSFPLWEQAVRQYGAADGVRYRLGRYVGDGGRLCAVSDADGEDGIDVFDLTDPARTPPRRLAAGELGRALELAPAPDGRTLAVANHRRQLLLVDVDSGAVRALDEAAADTIRNVAWAPDGTWLAYACPTGRHSTCIKLANAGTGEVHFVTTPEFHDDAPDFDPAGRYLYFVSKRIFDPVDDDVQFESGFPEAGKPYAVTLRADLPSPFLPQPRPPGARPEPPEPVRPTGTGAAAVRIDVDGIAERVIGFPVPTARYRQVIGLPDAVLLVTEPVEGTIDRAPLAPPPEKRCIASFDLVEQRRRVLLEDAGPVTPSADKRIVLYRKDKRLRVLEAGAELKVTEEAGDEPGRSSGWLDLSRIRVAVNPAAEWTQMFDEAWRFQRDYFWVPDMAGLDWAEIGARYRPLVAKVSTRAELSDLLWEAQGELGTSHAYEQGGEYAPKPEWNLAQLAIDLERDTAGRWAIRHVVSGDVWDRKATSPLTVPGAAVRPGETLLAVNGQPVDSDTGPGPLLVNQAEQVLELTIGDPAGANPRRIIVNALADQRPARYREWVQRNRRRVHEATDGRIGYLHIPNMVSTGFAEFHRGFLSEVERAGLVVDVRYNSGGRVSGLLLSKLARRRLGYAVSRWQLAQPYVSDAPGAPLVCVTNEWAGSDGDIVTHGFRMLGLGPVVGTRTWGGVIGISGRGRLADGTLTTQPEHAFWFSDVGWNVENHGTDPEYECHIAPQDHAAGRDPQLELAIELAIAGLAAPGRTVPDVPSTESRPSKVPTALPRRGR